jgi:hypothetical protein
VGNDQRGRRSLRERASGSKSLSSFLFLFLFCPGYHLDSERENEKWDGQKARERKYPWM